MERYRRYLPYAIAGLVAILLLLLLAVVLKSCSVPDFLKGPPKKGTVLEKKYEPARHYQEWNSCKFTMPVSRTRVVSDGKGGVTTEVYIDNECQGGYDQRFDDEDWKLLLEDCKMKEDGSKGKCRRGWREVRRTAYDAIREGQYYGGNES